MGLPSIHLVHMSERSASLDASAATVGHEQPRVFIVCRVMLPPDIDSFGALSHSKRFYP